MEDAQYLGRVALNPIRNDVAGSGDNQFTRAAHSTRTADTGLVQKYLYSGKDALDDNSRRFCVVGGNVGSFFVKIVKRLA